MRRMRAGVGGLAVVAMLSASAGASGAPLVIDTVAGNGRSGFSGDGGLATAAQLDGPVGVARTADGGFLIADTGNGRIRKVSAAGVISTVAGGGSATGDGVAATSAGLSSPED